MRIAVISPVFDSYSATWVQSVFNLVGNKINIKGESVHFSFISPIGCSNIVKVRNNCLKQVFRDEENMDIDFTHLLFADCDISFTYEDLTKLLSNDLDAVSGTYFDKKFPFYPTAGYYKLKNYNDVSGFPRIKLKHLKKNEPHKVDWVKMGFFLLKRKWIALEDYPWFTMPIVNIKSNDEKRKEILPEYVAFCRFLKRKGTKIYVDTGVRVKHEGRYHYSYDDYLKFQDIVK